MGNVMGALDGAILRGAQAAAQVRETLSQNASSIMNETDNLSDTISGPVADALNKSMTQWKIGHDKLMIIMAGFETHLRLFNQNLVGADQTQAAQFGRSPE